MRSKRILQDLLNRDTYTNCNYFANLFNVSTKTISNTMKILINDGNKNGFNIRLKRGRGYYIEITDKNKLDSYIEKIEYSEIVSPEYRVSYISVLLLLNKDFITMDYISEKIRVSKSIIKLDLNKVENELKEKKIILERKAHYGIRIVCSDYIRKITILQYYEDRNEFINSFMESKIDIEDFRYIENRIVSMLKENNLNTNHIELEEILAFIKVTICIRDSSVNNELIDKSKFTKLIIDLMDLVSEVYGILLTETELSDIQKYINNKTKKSSVKEVYYEDLNNYIENFMRDVDKEYNTKFNLDKEFKNNLLYHLLLLINRSKKDVSFSNPLVKEISIKYPTIFDMAIKFSNAIEDKYSIDITNDEIGFIATHFAVHLENELYSKLKNYQKIALICSTGKGSALLMKLKLEMLFSGSDIRTFSLLDENEVEKFNPDIIFSNWKLNKKFQMPVIYINELIDDLDILKIKNIFKMSKDNKIYSRKNDFIKLFRKEAFNIANSNHDYIDIIKEMGGFIEENGYAEENYTSYVLEREKYMSTIYDNGIAIPHPINICGKDNIVNVTILKNKVFYEGKEVKIIFMVSLEKDNLIYHEIITRILFKIMQDEKLVEKIRSSESYEDFIININEVGV